MRKTATIILFCLLTGQFTFAQVIFTGKLDSTDKNKHFTLRSENDSLTVSIDKKDIDFNANRNFQLIKVKNKVYNLLEKGDSIQLTESKSKIEYSNGLAFTISTKKAHQIKLADENGVIALDAIYKLKGNTADFEIKIFDKKSETELLAYATKYLYELSLNEANTVVPYYFFIY